MSTDPDNPAPLSGVDANNIAGKMIVANGSGLGVTVGSPTGLGNVLDIVNLSNPNNTDGFITQFNLPADPFSVALGGGIAFVADGTAGLQVVNYLGFDAGGVAPTVDISSAVVDLDPEPGGEPGIQVLEGSTIPIQADIFDDVQVRNVELLVDGVVVRNDVSFPFDLSAIAPNIPDGLLTDTVEIQVRATDTGGNTTTSAPLTLELVPDTFAPTITNINPTDGAKRGQAFRTVVINFNEAMDVSTLTAANIQLIGPGGVVAPTDVQVRNGDRIVQLTYDTLTDGIHQIVIDNTQVTDRAGNAIGAGTTINSFTIVEATAVFTNDGGTGLWSDAANWDGGVPPTATDDVLLDFNNGAGTVIFDSGNVTIRSLSSANAFTITGGTLTVTETVQVNNTFTMNGGTLKDATVLEGTGGQGISATSNSNSTLDGVTLEADSTLGNNQFLRIDNGLTLNAVLTLNSGANNTDLRFNPGDQTLGGTGEVVLAGTASNSRLLVGLGGAMTLTIGADIEVHGKGSILHSSLASVINNGTISADVSGQTLSITTNGFTNNGTAEAINGGILNISSATWTNTGTGMISAANSTLTLDDNWDNDGTVTANNSTVNLDGTFTQADLGTFTRTGGTVNLMGVLDNTGETLTFDAATGSWRLVGGTVLGGTVEFADGESLMTTSNGNSTFDGVILNSDLTMGNNQFLRIDNGLTLNAVLTLNSGVNLTDLRFNPGDQTLGGTGEVVLAGTASNSRLLVGLGGAMTLTIGADIEVHGKGSISHSSLASVINNGTISADVSGQTLTISTNGFTNNGTAEAINGAHLNITSATWLNTGAITATDSTLTLDDNWDNDGTVTANNSTVNLDGTFTQADLGTFMRTGGTVNLMGVLDNTGETLTFDAATGSWRLVGGTVLGGTVEFADGESLMTTSNGNSTFDGVILNSDLTMGNNQFLRIDNGLTLNAVLTLNSGVNLTDLRFNPGDQTLGGTGEVVLAGTASNSRLLVGLGGAMTLTIGADIEVHGKGSISHSSLASVINNGTISADVSGQTLTISTNGFTNNGTAEAINGAHLNITSATWLNTGAITATDSTLTLDDNWDNDGTVTANNSTVNLDGTFTQADLGTFMRTGGTVNLMGVLDNTGETLTFDAATGSWRLVGGTVLGGTVEFADGESLMTTSNGNSTFDGVILNSDLTMGNNQFLRIDNGLTLNAVLTLNSGVNLTDLRFNPGDQTLGGTGEVVLAGTASNSRLLVGLGGAMTLTIGADIEVHGKGSISHSSLASVINNGTISADVSGQTLTISTNGFTNNGNGRGDQRGSLKYHQCDVVEHGCDHCDGLDADIG